MNGLGFSKEIIASTGFPSVLSDVERAKGADRSCIPMGEGNLSHQLKSF
jgi:hypothetical protein